MKKLRLTAICVLLLYSFTYAQIDSSSNPADSAFRERRQKSERVNQDSVNKLRKVPQDATNMTLAPVDASERQQQAQKIRKTKIMEAPNPQR